MWARGRPPIMGLLSNGLKPQLWILPEMNYESAPVQSGTAGQSRAHGGSLKSAKFTSHVILEHVLLFHYNSDIEVHYINIFISFYLFYMCTLRKIL